MDFPSWHTCSAAICNWDNSGDLQAYIFTFTCIWCVCVATVILFLAFFVFLFFYSFIHLRVGEPLSMNQVCNTALCVMKEASVSPAQDVCNYWDFRKTAYNNEVKKNPRLDFVTSHHPPYTDIWVLSPECCHQTAVKATGGRGRGELWGGAFCSTGECRPGPRDLHVHHTRPAPTTTISEHEAGCQQQPGHLCIRLVIKSEGLLWSISYTEEQQKVRMVTSSSLCFQESKPITASLLPVKGKDQPQTWDLEPS